MKHYSRIILSFLQIILILIFLACEGQNSGDTDDNNIPDNGQTPTAPTDLSIDAITSASVKIHWTDNSDNETGFSIQRSQSEYFISPFLISSDSDSTSYVDKNLTDNSADVSLYYRIAAINDAVNDGNIEWTNSVQVDFPASPTGLTEVSKTATSVKLQWNDNSNIETAYTLQRSTDSGFSNNEDIPLPQSSKTYEDNSLPTNASYYYRIKAINDLGYSGWSNTLQVDLGTVITVNAPSNLQVKTGTLTETEVTLQWDDNSDNETGFVLEYSTNINFTNSTIITVNSANTTEKQISGLTAGTTYYFRIKAVRDDGGTTTPSAWHGPLQVTTNSSSAGNITVALSFTPNNSRVVYVAWIEDINGNLLCPLYVCNSIVKNRSGTFDGKGYLTGHPLPNFKIKNGWPYPSTSWTYPEAIYNVDTLTGASSIGSSGINDPKTVDIGVVTQFRICFEIDRSSNSNTYFPNDRPEFIYKTGIIDLNNLAASYSFQLSGWMSNATTGGYGQQPAKDGNGDWVVPDYEEYKFMDSAYLSYIADDDTPTNGIDNISDDMVQSLSVVISQ